MSIQNPSGYQRHDFQLKMRHSAKHLAVGLCPNQLGSSQHSPDLRMGPPKWERKGGRRAEEGTSHFCKQIAYYCHIKILNAFMATFGHT